MPNAACEEALYRKAVSFGVRFTDEELEEMGRMEFDYSENQDGFESADDTTQFEQDLTTLFDTLDRLETSTQPQPKKPGLFSAIIGLLSGSPKDRKKRRTPHRCDGDCDHCPAHYGYRYGRWYYGHGHQYGCQRGGNGGASGRTHRV